MTDKNVLEISIKILGEMMRSNSYNEVPPQSMCEESVEMAIYSIQHFKLLKSKMPTISFSKELI